jgi:hypothetical protein
MVTEVTTRVRALLRAKQRDKLVELRFKFERRAYAFEQADVPRDKRDWCALVCCGCVRGRVSCGHRLVLKYSRALPALTSEELCDAPAAVTYRCALPS